MKFKVEDKTFEVKICESFFSKFFGLMFSKKKNLLFVFNKKCKPVIHMFFVFYPIEIYFFDEDKKVLEKIEAKPFRVYKGKFDSKYILEIPKGK